MVKAASTFVAWLKSLFDIRKYYSVGFEITGIRGTIITDDEAVDRHCRNQMQAIENNLDALKIQWIYEHFLPGDLYYMYLRVDGELPKLEHVIEQSKVKNNRRFYGTRRTIASAFDEKYI